ncbi:N-acetylmuramic acid 6-phosphate etherase [Desnuesiella massiliensis]|uniref:N-acetylmuramic acid 6-phosphate etherase n=1 Tax=Desnuesiella massiliensis TaxID=1650662 RepID=UPI0006E23ED6|nr:N-acetylmuramic acid 6-phosphate etherase [Desnuesiella massiliensis]
MTKINSLLTEKRNKNSLLIDTMSIPDILKTINNEDKTIAYSIEKELHSISKVVEQMVYTIKNGGRVIYIGAGTSGRLGVLDSAECPPTYGTSPDQIIALIAGGEEAFTKAVESVEDSPTQGIIDLKNINFSSEDLLIGIAASGRTPYVEKALIYAREIGARTATLTCNKNSIISKFADNCIEIEVGPEVITGSTRMKAGTAQKLVLTMMSTTTMICLGKVYSNLMVDVQITNEKLKTRAMNIVKEITNCSEEEVERALEEAQGSAKHAIVMLLLDIDYQDSINQLYQCSNSLRKVLEKNSK